MNYRGRRPLAARARTYSSLASAHLAALLRSGLVTARQQGRQRYYRLASADIALAIDALLAIAPVRSAAGLTNVTRGKAFRRARTCYDHLAGQLGVALADAFEQRQLIASADGGWSLTSRGEHARRAGARYRAPAPPPPPRPAAVPGLDRTPPAHAGSLG